jgi:hypothetical protein
MSVSGQADFVALRSQFRFIGELIGVVCQRLHYLRASASLIFAPIDGEALLGWRCSICFGGARLRQQQA